MTSESGSQPIRVLSLDGGGFRGFAQALLLAELEMEFERPIAQMFDVIAGTSIGALIGAALVRPLSAGGRAEERARELAMDFEDHGSDIFYEGKIEQKARKVLPRRALDIAKLGSKGLSSPPPENQQLNELVKRLGLDDHRLTEAACEFIAPAYDVVYPGNTDGDTVVVFSKASAGTDGPDVSLGAAARASSAAPTYFPPELVRWQGRDRVLIDGGVFANNPALIALMHLWQADPGREIEIMSIGTGFNHDEGLYSFNDETQTWEVKNWEFGYKASLLMLEATSQAALHAIRGLERVPDSRVRLLSIQPDFGKDRPRLNEAHEDATKKIKAAAHETWSLQGKAMRAWVEGG